MTERERQIKRQQAEAELYKVIGKNVKRERERYTLLREELAKLMSESVAHLEKIESGGPVNVMDLGVLAYILAVPIDRFYLKNDMKTFNYLAVDGEEDNHISRDTLYSLMAGLNKEELIHIASEIKKLLDV